MAQRPAHELDHDPAGPEPRLELLPAVEEVPAEAEEEEEHDDEADEEAEARPAAKAEATQDPLKLYVRGIGDGPLLTAAEERELARRKDEGDEQANKKLIE
jgi:DNA-directed RNA polymerase sigma subunit (sigma70/sigma32)